MANWWYDDAMKRIGVFCTLAIGALAALSLAPAAAQTPLFRDDFNGTALDTTKWTLGTWRLGRTQLGNTPVVSGGIARLPFDTYQFRGCEIGTKAQFSRGNGLEITARVRLNNLPSGLVTSLFTYTTVNTLADEIDFEMLTKQVNASTTSDPILMTTWNDWNEASPTYGDGIHHWSTTQTIAGLNVNTWHTYTIRWLPTRTEWLLDGAVIGTTDKAQPNAPTNCRLNFWAAASGWTDAYDAALKPARRAKDNRRYFYDVDWVEVRQLP
jgi:beta-glucanase (GH16 family)